MCRVLIGVRGACTPGTAYVVPARACVWPVWWASWGRPGVSGLSSCPYPLVVVFVGVRFGVGVQGKNALLSEIYVLARSETSRPKDSCRKRTQKL